MKLNKTAVDTWSTTISYVSSINGLNCQGCVDQTYFHGAYFEYRLYIDDTRDMIGGNLQILIPVSKSSGYFKDIPIYYAYPWFLSKRGDASIVSVESPQLGRRRRILIYKPPSFVENPYKTYPTLLALDFNMEFYSVSADLINDLTVLDGTVGEYILIGFGDYDSKRERTDLLTQVKGHGFTCINGTFFNNCGGCLPDDYYYNYTQYILYMNKCAQVVQMGGKGNDTIDFLMDTVVPKAKQITNNRTRVDQPNLGIMGYSFGGLMACHAAWTRPDLFGFAACQSPSFWWPKLNDTADVFFFNNITLKDPGLHKNRPFQKIYLDAGGRETGTPFTLAQAMLSAAKDMSNTNFFEWDTNLWAEVYPGYGHSLAVWLTRIWKPLTLFFPTNPAPREALDKLPNSKCTTKLNIINGIGSSRPCRISFHLLVFLVAWSTQILF